MSFLELAIKNLTRHKIRNCLTLIGIISAVTALYAILSFNKSFMRNLYVELNKTGIHFMVVPAGCPHEVASLVLHGSVIPKFLPETIESAIREKLGEGIEVISPILVYQLPNISKQRIDLIYGIEMENIKNLKPWWTIKGRLPEKNDEILVGYEIAEHDNLKTGQLYSLDNHGSYKVVGIIEKTSSKDDAFVFLPLKEAQRLLNKEKAITAIGIKLKEVSKINDIVDYLSKEIPGIQIVTINQILMSIASLAASARILSLSIVTIAILISTISVLNVFLMTLFERTQEIGMMRAIGASKSHVFRIIIEEAIMLTTIGGLTGILISLVLSSTIERFVKSFMPYVPQGKMIVFDPLLAISCFIFTIFLGILAGFYPAYRAMKVSPIEAIKG